MRNEYKNLVGKLGGKRPFERSRSRLVLYIELYYTYVPPNAVRVIKS